MATNDERRRVAAELMELSKLVFAPENTYELLADALGVDDFDGTDELFARLADLIDPDTTKSDEDTTKAQKRSEATPKCDRDALLALADEMQGELDGCESSHEIAGNLQYWVDRIREACGGGWPSCR